VAPKWLSLFLNYSRKGLIEFANWQRNWIVKLRLSEENHKLICIPDLLFFIHVKGIFIHENASSTIYLVSCWEKQTCHQTLYQIMFSTQFAYMSACVFAANFEEFVNLYGELFTLHIINLRQQNCRDFFIKELVEIRNILYRSFILLNDRVYRACHATWFCLYRHNFKSNYALVRKKKSHKLATAGYISIAKERNLVAFFIYTEFSPCRVWLEHWRLNIWFVTRLRNPAQFPAQSTFFPHNLPPKSHTILIFFSHPVRRPGT